MRLFSQHSTAPSIDADDLNGSETTGTSGGLIEAVLDVIDEPELDEPQVIGGVFTDDDNAFAERSDDEHESMSTETAADGITSLLGRVFGKAAPKDAEWDAEPFSESQEPFEQTEIDEIAIVGEIVAAPEEQESEAADEPGPTPDASPTTSSTRRRPWRRSRKTTVEPDHDGDEGAATGAPVLDIDDEVVADTSADEVAELGALASLAGLIDDRGRLDDVEPQPLSDLFAEPEPTERRRSRRARRDRRTDAASADRADVEVPEPEPQPEVAVSVLTDEDLGLDEPPTLSRKERKALKKAEPKGRRARKKANEQADLELGSRVMALAATVPDGVKTLDYPKLYQNDDLLQMGLVARRRELAALHPKDDLDTLTAASVLGSVLRMDEELYSLKPRHILRKIVLIALAAGGGWFLAQKIKKDKEAEREADAIAHLDAQFGDGPRPPIPD